MNNAKPIKRILVIGIARSGTKWLTSILREHKDICAPVSTIGGVHEFNIEAFTLMFPDLSRHDQFIALVTLVTATDMYREMALPLDLPYRIEPRPRTVAELFGCVMDAYARRQGCSCWVQKFSPTAYRDLLRAFPSAYYVLIRRNRLDNLRSKLGALLRQGRPGALIKNALHVAMEQKMLRRFRRARHYVATIDYQELKDNQAVVVQRIFEHLGLPAEAGLTVPPRENTGHSSFRSNQERRRALPVRARVTARLVWASASLVPLALLERVWTLSSRQRAQIIRGTYYAQAKQLGYEYNVTRPSDP